MRMSICLLCVMFLTVALAAIAPSNGAEMEAYYPFNGNANDESGHGYDGTVHGATLCPDRFGEADRAYSIHDAGYIAIGEEEVDPPPPPNPTTAATFAAWVYLDQGGDGGYILNKGTYLVPEMYSLCIYDGPNAPRKLEARVNVGGNYYWATSDQPLLPEETWTHVAGVYDGNGTGLTLYVNGEIAANQPISGSLDQNERPLVFGGDVGNDGSFIEGRIDEVRIYNSALSQAEIQQIVPEPSTFVLLGIGAMSLLACAWRRGR
ncbi:MAG: PEP-CTERM sorting domain-containing protein [Planctomycetia bacterium]|nr:PEP-CTERM sorting domain-containing protein [Planctomycetia bacterium]